ncbi:MAG: hypothetical protein E2O93_09125 [Alphaproteobacteria bacterium]|nr:MAG: hypothetical protein E2O93_09125 [Alphaproteobacteria bacterium]
MARVLSFPVAKRPPKKLTASAEAGSASAEILIFPGVRVEYHEGAETVDLSRRIRSPRSGNEQKAAF